MTVKELKEKLSEMDENLEVTLCDYGDDSDECSVFRTADGVETVNANGSEFVCIYLDANH